ncbi:MAG TPA: 4-(cytidine 5'-diphospho)-2-C-methyl-D-erythritol kinase [Beijerinckiaceae bacterium]
MQPLTARAPAKVNLTLHVLGRRPDGYHDLKSLVAFAGTGDSLSLAPGPRLALAVAGPTAAASGADDDNLVLEAARALAARVPGLAAGAFRLTKRLPVAAGLGGGSSDAAAALRLLARRNGLPPGDPAVRDAARATGADVPACLDPRARMMGGAGEALGPPLRLPRLFAVLANPGVPVATADVFQALGLAPGEGRGGAPHPEIGPSMDMAALLSDLRAARNDLEPAATGLAPAVGEALALMRAQEGCLLSRMSGSGATVFGLFDGCAASAAAAKAIGRARPGWWVKATSLR